MTAQEKAKELVDKFSELAYVSWIGGHDEMTNEEAAKQCALIAVDEILSVLDGVIWTPTIDYWQQVKNEIEKL